jgi:hypothetical protein
MENADWKAIGRGALYVIPLIILSLFLAESVAHHLWIHAQICLLAILALLTIAAWHVRRLLLGRPAEKTRETPEDRGVATIVKLLQFTACGVVAIIIYAIRCDDWSAGAVAKTTGVGLLTAGASLAAGALLGFLFGVPKSQSTQSANSGEAVASGSAATTGSQFGANTNLEQISDWLTKTIVGVSLVELSKVPPLLNKLAQYIAAGMSASTPQSQAVVLVILVYFISAGFLTGYLWTRVELTRAFNDSTLSKRVSDLEEQSEIDAKAIASIDRWLNHHPAQQDEDKARGDMMDAIKSASSLAKARAFVTADDYKRNVPAAKIREAGDFTLPIFQALVEADNDGIFHRNRGQYAFSLMTQSNPDWSKALNTLQEAIKIRDGSKDPGWSEYEFARAICNIKLDSQAKTKTDKKSAIDADLKKADDLKLDQGKRDRLDLDGEVTKWRAGS